jgi:hypothetical protein
LSLASSGLPAVEVEHTLLAGRAPDGSPRFSGDFVQGPAGGKFVYVNSGTLAGQADFRWMRRAKVGLKSLKWATLEQRRVGNVLQARISGVGREEAQPAHPSRCSTKAG